MERSLVIIKPDGVEKGITGEIIRRFENAGLCIERLKMIKIERDLACRHYYEHKDKPYFERLINYITSDRSVIMILKGNDAIIKIREIMGPTDSKKAEPGTIRGDFGTDVTINVVHGSDSPESANREIKLFFENFNFQN